MFENPVLLMALCGVLFIGLGLPISLLLSARRGQNLDEVTLVKKAAKRARNPWQVEDEQLSELAQRVDKLKDEQD